MLLNITRILAKSPALKRLSREYKSSLAKTLIGVSIDKSYDFLCDLVFDFEEALR